MRKHNVIATSAVCHTRNCIIPSLKQSKRQTQTPQHENDVTCHTTRFEDGMEPEKKKKRFPPDRRSFKLCLVQSQLCSRVSAAHFSSVPQFCAVKIA